MADLKRLQNDARNGDISAIKQLLVECSRKQLDEYVLDVFLGVKQIESWHKEAQNILKKQFRKDEVWLYEDNPEKHWLAPFGWNVQEIKVAQNVHCQLYDDHSKLYGSRGQFNKYEAPIVLSSATTLTVKSSLRATGLGEYGGDSRFGVFFWLPQKQNDEIKVTSVKIEITLFPNLEWLETNLKRQKAIEWAEKTKADTPPNDRPPGFDPDDQDSYTFPFPGSQS